VTGRSSIAIGRAIAATTTNSPGTKAENTHPMIDGRSP
jgi:hypothetical protein